MAFGHMRGSVSARLFKNAKRRELHGAPKLLVLAGVFGASAVGFDAHAHQQRAFSAAKRDSGDDPKLFDATKLYEDVNAGMDYLKTNILGKAKCHKGSKSSDEQAAAQQAEEDAGRAASTSPFAALRTKIISSSSQAPKTISPGIAKESDHGLLSRIKDSITDTMDSAATMGALAGELKTFLGASGSDQAISSLVDKARETMDGGAFQRNRTFKDMFSLFQGELRATQETLSKTFGEIDATDLDPAAMFYFLETEDARKNPSWKRRKHRFMDGAQVEEVEQLHDALFLSDVSYLDTLDEVKQGLEQARDEWELVYCTLESMPREPSHFLAIRKSESLWERHLDVLIVVRGTKSFGDAFTDATMECVPYADGLAHSGMIQSGKWLVKQHADLIARLQEMSGKTVHLTCIGHSLGASAATVAGLEFRALGYETRVIGFGCPALLSKDLSEKCKDFVTTVVADADLVPRLSGATLANLTLDLLEFDYTEMVVRDVKDALEQLRRRAPDSLERIITSRKLGLTDAVEQSLESVRVFTQSRIKQPTTKRAKVELFPPGEILHIYRDGRGVSAAYAPCDFFDEIDVSRTMIDDHLISGYDKIFLELLRDYHGDQHYTIQVKKG